jgi:hypothetical protein
VVGVESFDYFALGVGQPLLLLAILFDAENYVGTAVDGKDVTFAGEQVCSYLRVAHLFHVTENAFNISILEVNLC